MIKVMGLCGAAAGLSQQRDLIIYVIVVTPNMVRAVRVTKEMVSTIYNFK